MEARLRDISSLLMWFWVSCWGSMVSKNSLTQWKEKSQAILLGEEENFALKCIKDKDTSLCSCSTVLAVLSQNRKPVFSR